MARARGCVDDRRARRGPRNPRLGGERGHGRARLLSFREAVAEISAVTGSEFSYVPVSARDHGDTLLGFVVSAEEVESLVEAFEALLDGRDASVSDGVREVLGREARDFTEFAREAAASGGRKA